MAMEPGTSQVYLLHKYLGGELLKHVDDLVVVERPCAALGHLLCDTVGHGGPL